MILDWHHSRVELLSEGLRGSSLPVEELNPNSSFFG